MHGSQLPWGCWGRFAQWVTHVYSVGQTPTFRQLGVMPVLSIVRPLYSGLVPEGLMQAEENENTNSAAHLEASA